MNRILLIAAGLLAAPAEAASSMEAKVFARADLQGWRLEASVRPQMGRFEGQTEEVPVVDQVMCRAQRNGMTVHLDRLGLLVVQLGGEDGVDEDGDKRTFTFALVRRLRLGGVEYESRVRHTNYPRWRFEDVTYPLKQEDEVILPLLQGHLEVRSGAGSPWIPINALIDEMMRAETLRIGHARMVDDKIEPLAWFTLPLTGLSRALVWCQNRIYSDEPYRFYRPDEAKPASD